MKFTQIVLFSLKDFNKNKEKQGYHPHEGTVINILINANTLTNYAAVGFE